MPITSPADLDDVAVKKFLSLVEPEVMLARKIKALSDPNRLKILRVLAENTGNICVYELTALLAPLAQPTVSNHLNVLVNAGLVVSHKFGLYAYYRVCNEELEKLLSDTKRLIIQPQEA